ncbi:MAG: hypothetical protein AABY22_34430 [Nanoarchaeota archaeon]
MKTKIIKYKGKKIEVGIEDIEKGKRLDEIKIPKGWKLWTYQMCIDFHNDEKLRKKLDLEDCWFYVEQPFELNKNYVAGFRAFSDWVVLYCNCVPRGSDTALGVRFWREVK